MKGETSEILKDPQKDKLDVTTQVATPSRRNMLIQIFSRSTIIVSTVFLFDTLFGLNSLLV